MHGGQRIHFIPYASKKIKKGSTYPVVNCSEEKISKIDINHGSPIEAILEAQALSATVPTRIIFEQKLHSCIHYNTNRTVQNVYRTLIQHKPRQENYAESKQRRSHRLAYSKWTAKHRAAGGTKNMQSWFKPPLGPHCIVRTLDATKRADNKHKQKAGEERRLCTQVRLC